MVLPMVPERRCGCACHDILLQSGRQPDDGRDLVHRVRRVAASIVNVSRGGPGLGTIQPSQGDYFQSVKGGGHGDYRLIVLAPSSVQEMAGFVYDAFDLADRYWNPVMILADGALGQMMEKVEFPDYDPAAHAVPKPWATTGKPASRPANVITSLHMLAEQMEEVNHRLQAKYRLIEEKEVRYELLGTDDAEYLIVAFGLAARIAHRAVQTARANGHRVGLIRPITLFPYPGDHPFVVGAHERHPGRRDECRTDGRGCAPCGGGARAGAVLWQDGRRHSVARRSRPGGGDYGESDNRCIHGGTLIWHRRSCRNSMPHPSKGWSASMNARERCPRRVSTTARGAAHSVVHRVLMEVIEEMGIAENTIGVAPVGCSVFAYHYMNIDMQEAAHGRASAVATAVKRIHPDKYVFSYQGDGDLAAIGTAETIHTCNRGENILMVFINNAIYGMTGGQMAPTSLMGMKTSTSPAGRTQETAGFPLKIADMVALLPGVSYVTRQSVHTPNAVRQLKKTRRSPSPGRKKAPARVSSRSSPLVRPGGR